MALSGGAIAGITIVSVVGAALLAGLIYFVIDKRRKNAEYMDRCGRLWKKYGNRSRGSDMMARFPYADPTFVRTPVPGQQFTQRELNPSGSQEFVVPGKRTTDDDTGDERKPLISMYTPIDPAAINPKLYTDDKQEATGDGSRQPGVRPPQVFFSLEFDETYNTLKVYIEQAKFLRPISFAHMCDPYCVVCILPGGKEKQSQIKRKTVDPLFEENFSFELAKSELKDKSVQIRFYDYDQYSKDELIGTVVQRLDEINLNAKVDLWRKIALNEPAGEASSVRAGDLLLRLGYLPSAEKLTVVLLKARSLREVGPDGEKRPPDPYIRVAVLHEGTLVKKKKTSTKKGTSNPTYNQAINFAVPLHVLPQIEIQFHVVHESGVKLSRDRKEIIGSLEIGPHSSGDEKDHWRDLMSNKPQARWHHLTASSYVERVTAEGRTSIKE